MKDEIDIDPVGKTIPLKGVKLPSRATEIQQDVREISQLDPSYNYKSIDYLSQSNGVQTDMVKEVREQETIDATMRLEQYREAKESFMTMMEIRNVLVDAYDEVRKMRGGV